MYKLCRTEQSAKRQREIEKCLFDILRIKNYDDITVTDICTKMNMPRKAFYRYFDSKDDALDALLDHSMSEYSGFTVDRSGETDRSLTLELEEYFVFWYGQKDLLDALDRSGLIGNLIDRMIKFPVGDRIAVHRFLPYDDDKMRKNVLRFAFSGLVYLMVEWYRDGFVESTRSMAETACRLLKEPLFPNLDKLGIK